MNIFYKITLVLFLLLLPSLAWAMLPGTLLYRTSSAGKMYGYSSDSLISTKNRVMTGIYPGHVGLYIGQENGLDYVVETLAGGVVKTLAKNFVNLAQGEKFLGAKIPINLSPVQRAKVVMIAKSLATKNLGYDFDFRKQKGPNSGDWTCVGLVEKVYESANISNPNNLASLEYDPQYYAINITPDGFDDRSVVNDQGDVFSTEWEFSKIARRDQTIIPAPELIGYNAGLEHQAKRYIFLPYTQFLQSSLKDVVVDIPLSSSFSDQKLRGSVSKFALMLKWSLLNNPLSSLKTLAARAQQTIIAWQDKLFSSPNTKQIAFQVGATVRKSSSHRQSTKRSRKKKTSSKLKPVKASQARVLVSKNTHPRVIPKKVVKKKTVKNKAVKEVSEEKTPLKLADFITKEKGIKIDFSYPVKTEDKKVAVPIKKVSNISVQKKKIVAQNNGTGSSSYSSYSPSAGSASSSSSSSSSSTVSTSDVADSSVATSSEATSSEEVVETEVIASSTTETTVVDPVVVEPDYPKLALINRVYNTANNDWLELYNPGDHDFDLATANYRLEKTKTAEDPSLALRIGNLDDATYPGGTVIKAKGYYLIVRDEADAEYLAKADAIAQRSEFGWFDSGYTLYLGTGTISSSTDVDIIDALGFGPDASYFAGVGPAPAIDDYYVLTRIATTSDNSLDYELVATDKVIATTTETEIVPAVDDSVATTSVDSLGIESNQISYLEHFDDCYGEGKWAVGKWGCARESGYTYEPIEVGLDSGINLNNFSISFYYRDSRPKPQISFSLLNSDGEVISLAIEDGLFKFSGLPTTSNLEYTDFSITDNWDQLTLVVDQADDYWSLYINGVEKYRQVFAGASLAQADHLQISGSTNSFLIDELVLWNRALSSTEVLANYQADLPFSPLTVRPSQETAQIIHAWDFDEGEGTVAKDSLAGADLEIPAGLWVVAGKAGGALLSREGAQLEADFSTAIITKDFSLDFWWRNQSYPSENGLKISLSDGDKDRLALIVDYYRPAFVFNDHYGIISQGADKTIPNDDAWHYLALSYDSYHYRLNFYVDGEEKYTAPFIWVDPSNNPDRLTISTSNNRSEIDNLRVWQGTLRADTIADIYASSP